MATLLIFAIVLEAPHRMLPKIVGPAGDHLVVIGDSISAGLNQNISWPDATHSHT
jgi:phospholipase/lecithinase/hemolysin